LTEDDLKALAEIDKEVSGDNSMTEADKKDALEMKHLHGYGLKVISTFLLRERGIKISQPSLSKGLKRWALKFPLFMQSLKETTPIKKDNKTTEACKEPVHDQRKVANESDVKSAENKAIESKWDRKRRLTKELEDLVAIPNAKKSNRDREQIIKLKNEIKEIR